MSPKKKILLVDDADTVLMIEKIILRKADFEVFVAKNGEDAVKLALSKRPDLILMDVIMPVINGLEACERLRKEAATKDTPIILVTTQGQEFNIDAGYRSGCTDYMTKPINGPELIEKINKYLK
ncbi:MAG: response regulator [Nitrospirae bacterium]|nr:response regulator [Nitrospirota bacterium]